jgi:hypothetical protein
MIWLSGSFTSWHLICWLLYECGHGWSLDSAQRIKVDSHGFGTRTTFCYGYIFILCLVFHSLVRFNFCFCNVFSCLGIVLMLNIWGEITCFEFVILFHYFEQFFVVQLLNHGLLLLDYWLFFRLYIIRVSHFRYSLLIIEISLTHLLIATYWEWIVFIESRWRDRSLAIVFKEFCIFVYLLLELFTVVSYVFSCAVIRLFVDIGMRRVISGLNVTKYIKFFQYFYFF